MLPVQVTMPPSTVFSYWRRDHRRSSASPVPSGQPASKEGPPVLRGNVADNPPQLPQIPNTPTLSTSIGESSALPDAFDPQPSDETSPDVVHQAKPNVSRLSSNAPSSSSTNLAIPPSASEKQLRPRSSPEGRHREPALTAQSNHSQLSFTTPRHDSGDGDSYKQSTPFRLSLGKGLLNTRTPSFDGNKRASTPGMTATGHFRFKPSPEGSPADKPVSQKDYKFEGVLSRRHTEREASMENGHHKSGKAMLHLLNPMSLLARRRSSQLAGSRAMDTNIAARNVVPAIPDDYDPRIRGNIVHDFSTPRPRRNVSTAPSVVQDRPSTGTQSRNERGSAAQAGSSDHSNQPLEQKRRSDHSPVFKEHFDDDERVLQVENKAYLQSPLLVNSHHRDYERSVPAFAKNLPSRLPNNTNEQTNDRADIESKGPSTQQNETRDQGQDADTVEKVPQLSSALPKRFKSNASRFSFDMNAVESSTQEKLLEEKHKEKEAQRRAKARLEGEDYSDVDDDYDDIMDDADDLEEKIPGVNVDADEDELGGLPEPKSWFAPGLSPVVASPISPVGSNFAASASNAEQRQSLGPVERSSVELSHSPSVYEDGAEVEATTPARDHGPGPTVPSQNLGTNPIDDDDDLYFDDGEFGDLGIDPDAEKFDESIFDDETSHLYDRKPSAERLSRTQTEEYPRPNALLENDESDENLTNGHVLKHVPSMVDGLQPAPSINYGHPSTGPIKSHGGVLTEHNLEALHNALAKAANETARTSTVSDGSSGQESAAQTAQTTDSHPGLVSDDSRLSQAIDALGFDEAFEDFSHDDDDNNALYDDPIIAAANAEALENDDEGFYGQEFGFYAHIHGNGSSELTNGGYFGPRGIEGVSRSYSSRGKFREPSLTPITERSEWSTRNSVISLTAHGTAHSNPSLPSPGLAQLVDMGNIDDEMSLSALMKLRRNAFGGSNGSLRSSSGSPPPHQHSSSNRGSFAGLSDMSPTGLDSKVGFGDLGVESSPIDWSSHDLDQLRSSREISTDEERPDHRATSSSSR